MQLVQIINKKVVISSIQLAKSFDKQHKDILESIRQIRTAENSAILRMFQEAEYTNEQNKKFPMYLMNRDGFSLLAMSFTGEKALQWKLKYIEAFNKMEKELQKEITAKKLAATKSLQSRLSNTQSRVNELLEEHKYLQAEYDKNLRDFYQATMELKRHKVFKSIIEAHVVQKGNVTLKEVNNAKKFVRENLLNDIIDEKE